MPTTANITYSNTAVDPVINPDDAQASMLAVKIKASSTLAAGTVVGEIAASPGTYGAYATGNSDGTQNPVGILRRAVVTDASSNITNQSEWGTSALTTAIYTEGVFRTQDLVGLDAGAVTALKGRLLEGSVTTGLVSF